MTTTAPAPPAVRTPARMAVTRFLRHRLAVAGLVLFGLIVLLVVFGPAVARFTPEQIDLLARNQPPNAVHWLGTDQTGRDIFARTLSAGRVSLLVGLLSTLISVVVGTTLGALAGYFGGWVDNVIMRCVDVVMTFPSIIVLLTLAAIIGPGIDKTIIIIGLLGWPLACRLVRAKLLSVRELEFITAATALGAPDRRILLRHALPNVVDVLVVFVSLGVASAILLEAGLSFLGLGVQPPQASWGNLLTAARELTVLEAYPWQWMPAGALIVLTVLATNFVGDGLRDALDPKAKA
ncbi:ABC transporter permease (plasmid) [Deinococcus metallilatus]|uniref:Peptide/nickel transport system permease protein n=1 Tax=Deinococcus metallilatus TaxID=1211322 RepID=A0ABR6MYC6_9DEIO|nr:oligopeptide ABC transporter permease [Deinococcus metallilatus]MBB5296954.1 peptide/nickel transport system permease protein [Deinococcus metallilatus]QBY06678.1 ABC transporter permease [Deinococcus metallilatus]GMA15147.1 peptide ABC transporter permease [Deinococcus metallilatus]